jgi:peroxiredoxin/nitrate/TMAO reductase-like tetraheme cytochrome c subunit
MLPAVGVRALAVLLALVLSAACGAEDSKPPAPARAEAPVPEAPPAKPAPRTRDERPLPAFEGVTLTGERVHSSNLIGRRLILFFFDPSSDEAETVGKAVASVSKLRGKHNFDVIGVGTSASRDELESFVASHGLDFPVLDDSRGGISRKLGLRFPAAIVGVDGEGYLSFGMAHFPAEGNDPAGAAESQIRERLRLPALGGALEPVLGEKPLAPAFEAVLLGGGSLSSDELRGRAAVLIFFLHTCPHCHHALEAMKKDLEGLPESTRPRLVGVSLTDRSSEVRAELAKLKLDFFEVVFDSDETLRNAYGATGGTPDIFLIDAEGRVTARVQGWRDERDPPLMRMRLARLAGAPVPMLLHQSGYSGNEFCGACHESQHATYELTAHSLAYDTLVKHGAERDAECVSCHVVGFEQSGGFEIGGRASHLEDVGCESCHGRGGPHLSPEFVSGGYESVCVTCHDPKHSLGFEYATFHPRVSHAANAHLLDLGLEEKRRLLAERAQLRKPLLPDDARYVGSDACRSCHEAEFATWQASPHAASLASLEQKGKADSAECLACHTTGMGRPGGFPTGGQAAGHPDLARVGCESCHGPGEAHVAEGATRIGTILSLGDKCDSCVILQICGSCHDDENDPQFEFEVQEKIDAQRHGTIEAGTGKPKESQARLEGPALVGTLERVFRSFDERG